MPKQSEAMVVEDMPHMTQFVYDMYNERLSVLLKNMPVHIKGFNCQFRDCFQSCDMLLQGHNECSFGLYSYMYA